MAERIPPQDIDAEQSVLGAMLLDREAVFRTMEILRPEDFYRESHRIIYEAILKLNETGSPVDLITISDELRRLDKLEQVGGVTYVATLTNLVPTAANVEYYARIVEEKALARALIQITTRVASQSYEGNESSEKILADAERALMELGGSRDASALTPVFNILPEAFEQIEFAYKNQGKINGVPTGFIELDRMTTGLQPGDLIILAARPSAGKTSLGVQIGQQAAIKNQVSVAVFSLEMSKQQLVQRILCSEAMLDQFKVRQGNLAEEDWAKLTQVAGYVANAPIYIDDTAAMTVREMRAKARRLKAEKGLGLIVIDYLQLMQGNRRTDNRQQEIAEISRALKALAKELNVPVLALSQLSRAVEQRQDKRPIMSDLRESGSLEQDADVVMFIYRDEYYNPDTEKKGIAEIIIAKQRNGPVGSVELGFFKEFTKFVNLAKREE